MSGLLLLGLAVYGQPAAYLHEAQKQWHALVGAEADTGPSAVRSGSEAAAHASVVQEMSQLQREVAALRQQLAVRESVPAAGVSSPTPAVIPAPIAPSIGPSGASPQTAGGSDLRAGQPARTSPEVASGPVGDPQVAQPGEPASGMVARAPGAVPHQAPGALSLPAPVAAAPGDVAQAATRTGKAGAVSAGPGGGVAVPDDAPTEGAPAGVVAPATPADSSTGPDSATPRIVIGDKAVAPPGVERTPTVTVLPWPDRRQQVHQGQPEALPSQEQRDAAAHRDASPAGEARAARPRAVEVPPAARPAPPPRLAEARPVPVPHPRAAPAGQDEDTRSVLARLRQGGSPPAQQASRAEPQAASPTLPRLQRAQAALRAGRVDDAVRQLQEAQLQLVFRPVDGAGAGQGENPVAAGAGAGDVARALEALSANNVAASDRYIDRAMDDLTGERNDTATNYSQTLQSGYAPAYPTR